MAEKRYIGAPFGTQTARFDVSGVHPQNKMPGTFTEAPYCKRINSAQAVLLGPGTYVNETGDFTAVAIERKSKGPNWERAVHSARLDTIPRRLYRKEWEHKEALRKRLGPGIYDIKDFIIEQKSRPSSARGVCQTLETRFGKDDKVVDDRDRTIFEPSDFQRNTPGPGVYSIPSFQVKASPGVIGVLENGGRVLHPESVTGSGLPPGLYRHSDPTQEVLDRQVSRKGPYELFSGDREQPSKLAMEMAHLGPGKYELQPFTVEWNDRHRQRHGRFSTETQYPEHPTSRFIISSLSQCPRPLGSPGPTHYNYLLRRTCSAPVTFPSAMRFSKQGLAAGNSNPVGPAQYSINSSQLDGHSNGNASVVFVSGTPRLPPRVDSARERLLQERITPKYRSHQQPAIST